MAFAGHRKLGQVLFCLVAGVDTVGKLSKLIETKHSTIMEHVSKLEDAGLVSSTKRGRERKYKIEWNRLVDLFASLLIDYEKATTLLLFGTSGTDMYPIPPAYPQARQAMAAVELPQGMKYPGYAERDLEKREKITPAMQKTLKENTIVRDFIRKYLETYSQLYYAEDDFSLLACVKNFKDRLALLVESGKEIKTILGSKPKKKEFREFVEFINYAGLARIPNPNEFACINQMQRFVRSIGAGARGKSWR